MRLPSLLPGRLPAEEPAAIGSSLTLSGQVEIKATKAGDDGKTGPPKFEALAYTGEPMRLEGWRNPVVIDLKGIRPRNRSLPVLRDHDPQKVVGHTTSFDVTSQGVVVRGVVSGSGADANEVVANAKNAYPWQISLGSTPDRKSVEHLGDGRKATVNGREIIGPASIVRKATTAETSFVAMGADGNTSAAIAATKGDGMSLESQAAEADPIDRESLMRINATITEHERELGSERANQLRVEAIDGRLAEDKVTGAVLAAIRSSRSHAPPIGGTAQLAGVAPSQMLEAAFLVRAGYGEIAEKEYGERVMEASSHLHNRSFLELVAASFQLRGVQAPSNRDDMLRMAFSPVIQAGSGVSYYNLQETLGNAMNRALQSRYVDTPATWRAFCGIRSASDFKKHTSIRPSAIPDLEQIGADGLISHGKLSEETYSWYIDTFAKMIAVARKDVINDNLNLFDEIINGMVPAAMRTLSNLVYNKFLNGVAGFFSEENGNLGNEPLSVTSLGKAITAMRKQRDKDGHIIDMRPATLLVAPENEQTAKAALDSEFTERVATASDVDEVRPTGNPQRQAVKLEVEPRLSHPDQEKFPGAKAEDWYLFGPPSTAPMIVGFLDGQQVPKTDFFDLNHEPSSLIMSWRVYHDFGAAMGDFRAAYKSSVPVS